MILGIPPKVPEPGVDVEVSLGRMAADGCLKDGDPLVIYLERIEGHREAVCSIRGDCP